MKAILFALFVGLLLVGCGGPDLDDPETLQGIIANAVDRKNLNERVPADLREDYERILRDLAGSWGSKEEMLVELKKLRKQKAEFDKQKILYLLDTDTPYTGWAKLYHGNGKIRTLAQFKDGKSDGAVISWYENGKKEEEVKYQNGKQNGLWIRWHANGQKRGEGNMKDGKADGLFTRWHESGRKESLRNWKDGKADGLSIFYSELGREWPYTFKDGELQVEDEPVDPDPDAIPVTTLEVDESDGTIEGFSSMESDRPVFDPNP